MPDVTFLTFNYGNAGRYANGPGICLTNFVKDLKSLGVEVEVFSIMESWDKSIKDFKNTHLLDKAIKSSKIIHLWSDMFDQFSSILNKWPDKKIFIGPNVIDGENPEKELGFLSNTKFSKLFVVNKRIKFKVQKNYNIDPKFVEVLMIGPDQDLWQPSGIDNGSILWKGNCTHKIKDINFGLEVAKRLPNYKFKFIGYPTPYTYYDHINEAKECHMYFTTSISETMGLALCESWSSGLPSVSHPKIEVMGENYSTGIITNRTIDDYCIAITEIMENEELYRSLKLGAVKFVKDNFSNTAKYYIEKNIHD